MKVAWLTARCFGSDLCDTTQSELAKGLAKKGIELTVYSPGELISDDFNHVSIKRSMIKGLQTISVIRGITNHLSNINTMDCVWLIKVGGFFQSQHSMGSHRSGLQLTVTSCGIPMAFMETWMENGRKGVWYLST